jgi:K+-transporting ATPase ATPase A chain
LTGVDEKREMRWTEYAVAMLLFSGVSMTLLYLIERTQKWLPFNPQKFPNVEPGLAFGTAASFTIPILACGFRPSLRRSSDALGRHRHLL